MITVKVTKEEVERLVDAFARGRITNPEQYTSEVKPEKYHVSSGYSVAFTLKEATDNMGEV